jgi:hypothetical protein
VGSWQEAAAFVATVIAARIALWFAKPGPRTPKSSYEYFEGRQLSALPFALLSITLVAWAVAIVARLAGCRY